MADNNEFYRLNLVLKMDDRLSSAMSKVDGKVAKFNSNLSKTQKTVDKLGGSRLMRLKNEPHLGYSTTH